MDTRLNMTREEFGATMMCVGFTADQFELVCSYTDKLETELKAKDEEIKRLGKAAKDKYEYHTELTDKWAKECKAKDKRIVELEAKNQELEDLLVSHYPNYISKDNK